MSPDTPRFFDPQVNGYAGIDFQRDRIGFTELQRATEAWKRDGGDAFYLTLITDAWPSLIGRIRHLRSVLDQAPELRATIVGWHIEGPFLSEKPGFHGAHDPAVMMDPSPERVRELRDAAGDDPLLLTLAPERPGALLAIETARSLGIEVSLGHTDASATQIGDAVEAGATTFTHLANGCPQQLDRHDNILWRVLDTPGIRVGLIADGIHVSPALFRLIHRVLPPDRLYYTTDAMAAAGSPPGEYTIGRLRVQVGADGIVRQPGHQNFAGSALSPNRLVESVRRMLSPHPDSLATAGAILQQTGKWRRKT